MNPVLTELEGYRGLGMKREALRLTRRILRQPTVTAVQFAAALNTLLTMEHRLKHWRRSVEETYTRLSPQGQRRVRFWMLSFHFSSHDYPAAARLIPKRFREPYGLVELAFAWDIWAELGDEKSSARHYKRIAAGAAYADDPFMRGSLLASLGDYCLRKGQWRRATECYRKIPVESAHAHQAALGPLMALAGEFLAACGEATETLSRFQRHYDPDLGSSLTNELSAEYRKAGHEISALNSGLRRLLGKKRLKELAVSTPL